MAKINGKNIGDFPGRSVDYHGGVVPLGFLLEDGTSYLVASYPALFAIIGYTHGGAGANFNVPDSRRKVHVGSGGTGTGTLGNALGNTGGEESHALSIAETPAHDHGGGNHGHSVSYPNGQNIRMYAGNGNASSMCPDGTFHQINPGTLAVNIGGPSVTVIASQGGNGSHNNIQPSMIVTKMIKY